MNTMNTEARESQDKFRDCELRNINEPHTSANLNRFENSRNGHGSLFYFYHFSLILFTLCKRQFNNNIYYVLGHVITSTKTF